MSDLETRALKLAQELAAFGAELRLACAYTQVDPASSLTKSRIVMEKLLVNVYAHEMGQEPRKPLLGEMLADNQFTRKIDRRILSRMNAIRDMGNLGPHGAAVEASDAVRVLDDLCTILDWHLQRQRSSPGTEPPSLQPTLPTPSPGPPASTARPPARARRTYQVAYIVFTVILLLVILVMLFGPRLGNWREGDPSGGSSSVTSSTSSESSKSSPPLTDLDKLQGSWKTIEVETDGQVGKPLFATMVIKGDALNYFYEDGRPGNTFTFELAPDKRPRQIDLVTTTTKRREFGIYSLDGDILKVCMVRDPTVGTTPRPTDFRTTADSNLIMMTFKRK